MQQIVYWAHSYRPEDAKINEHFGRRLIEDAGRMIVNFDPPSKSVNEAKLLQNLRSCDGMVAVLTWRATGPSPYILFEIGLAMRARKPVIVFMDDRIPSSMLPSRIMQRRFSASRFFRQVRDHLHSLQAFKSYMGDPPPPRYQPSADQSSCGLIGLSALDAGARIKLTGQIEARGYRAVDLEKVASNNPLIFEQFELLAVLDVVVRCADVRSTNAVFWSGAVSAAALPTIAFTTNREYRFSDRFPVEFQPRLANAPNTAPLDQVLGAEFDLFEQNFLNVEDPAAIDRYVETQIRAGALDGNYETGTRRQFIGAIMGDQYNISGQAAAIGPNAKAENISFNQTWNQMESRVDLAKLADELARLKDAMERSATQPEQKMAAGAVAAAEQCARDKNGPKVLEYLKTGGKWAFEIAEKIGVEVATAAIKGALGI